MEYKGIFYSKSGIAFLFIFASLIGITVQALPSGQGKHGRYNKRSVKMSREQRSVDSYDSVLPSSVSMQTLKNASIMVCTEAMAQPYARMVQLNDDHMRALLQDKGGNYVKDYMAVTPEEALENFPNMLMLTRPLQDSEGVTSFSVADNLITKQMIINDLNKLTAYLMKNDSTTDANDTKPVDANSHLGGIFKPNETFTTKSTFTSKNIQPKNDSSDVMTTPSTSKATIDPISNSNPFETSTFYSTKINVDSTTKISSAHRLISTGTTATVSTDTSTSILKQTSLASKPTFSNLDTTTPTPPASQGISTSLKRTTHNDDITPISTRTNSGQTKSTTADPGNLYSIGGKTTPDTKDNSVTLETKITSTLDPDVLKSIEGLQNYVKGSDTRKNISHFGKRELETIWRNVDTTLHPTILLGLTTGNTRLKRHADDSYSHEEYCQNKGSLTVDHKFVHLCSICAATTKLPDDMFPRYINEAVCKTGDTDCFTIAGKSHGQCKQTKFSLNMLRKKVGHCNMIIHGGESLVFDNWELVPHLINVSCECTINKLSVFSKYAGLNVPLG